MQYENIKREKIKLSEANKARREIGILEINRGIAKCLKCDNDFFSKDKRSNRICPCCKHSNKDYIEQSKIMINSMEAC